MRMLAFVLTLAGCTQAERQNVEPLEGARSALAYVDAQRVPDAHPGQRTPSLPDDPDSADTLFAGLLDCAPKGWYLDSGRPVNPYLARHAPEPCEREAAFGMAYFCLSADFHGLPVYQVVTHLGTAPTPFGVLIDLPLDEARSRLRKALGTELREGKGSRQGRTPVLGPHGDGSGKSQLICTPTWA